VRRRRKSNKHNGKSVKDYGTALYGRSSVTNGHQVLPTIDHRSVWGRRYRDLALEFKSDLAQDDDALSAGQRALLRRCAAMCLECEHLEAKFARLRDAGRDPDPYDLNIYQRTVNSLRRLIETIGTHHGRLLRDVTLSLGDVLRAGIDSPVEEEPVEDAETIPNEAAE
jgi:hypothetical protein